MSFKSEQEEAQYNLNLLEKLKKEKSLVGSEQYRAEQEETHQVGFICDPKVSKGLFRPNTKIAGQYFVHPITFKALRKDIIISDPELLLFQKVRKCTDCQKESDLQFFHSCPFCGKPHQL